MGNNINGNLFPISHPRSRTTVHPVPESDSVSLGLHMSDGLFVESPLPLHCVRTTEMAVGAAPSLTQSEPPWRITSRSSWGQGDPVFRMKPP